VHQPGVLAPVPAHGRFLVFDARADAELRPALARLADARNDAVVGFGAALLARLGVAIAGLRAFPAICGREDDRVHAGLRRVAFPSTQGDVWAFVGGDDVGDVLDRGRAVRVALGAGFALREDVATFRYRGGRDLTGFVDGTENPHDERAVAAAIVAGRGRGLDGSTFVAVQRWVHDLERFARYSADERDAAIGRRLRDDVELEDAPASAHVKRTAQESFDPAAFVVRRSMPWGGVVEHGLYFVAYGATLDAFERQLARMAGIDDGIVDALAGFTRAVTGGYYWCPPLAAGALDLSALAL
jgi:putative iron-dependent peroxidase